MKKQLLTGASVLAVALAAGGGVLANIDQTATNTGAITNDGAQIETGELVGDATQGQVGAIGALTGANFTAISSGASVGALGAISQASTNSGAIAAADGTATGDDLSGAGASLNIAATGATAGVAESIIGSTDDKYFGEQTDVTSITSDATNNNGGVVSVTGGSVSALELSGNAASLGISASGASVGASVGSVGAELPVDGQSGFAAANMGDITQTATNNSGATVTVSDSTVTSGAGADEYTGGLTGHGASAMATAVGASVSTRNTMVDSTGNTGGTFGIIAQDAKNSSEITVNDTDVAVYGDLGGGDGTGLGASASLGVTGASASVGVSSVNSGSTNTPVFGAIEQGTFGGSTQKSISNDASITLGGAGTPVSVTTGELKAAGTSIGASANGAVASVFEQDIASTAYGGASFDGAISSHVSNSGGVTIEETAIKTVGVASGGPGEPAAISGTGASASISGGGALASLNSTSIGSAEFTGATFAEDITQKAANTGAILVQPGTGIEVGAITGDGAGASISARGASASVGSAAIDSTAFTGATFSGDISQEVTNNTADPTVTISADGVDAPLLQAADIGGAGASASISAAGAVASVGSTSIGGETVVGAAFEGAIDQTVSNAAAVTITPSTADTSLLAVGEISGAGAGASISAGGALASVGSTSIGGDTVGGATFGATSDAITQNASNTAAVSIADGAALLVDGPISGNGASASISAVGASTGVSVLGVDITDTYVPSGPISGIDQTATNNTTDGISITNAVITTGDLSGAGAGASIGATGASASISGAVIDVASVATPISIGAAGATQVATNSTAITVSGANITTGALTGNGASAGISAVGASATVGMTAIGSGTTNPSP
ncbi:beta strand repeat-containing protein [Paracoccus sp. (in: a-proteobacteria)]